jgi:hypothetical protein
MTTHPAMGSSGNFAPPQLADIGDLVPLLLNRGFVVASAAQVCVLANVALAEMMDWRTLWNAMPSDTYLRDAGRYRSRRHSCMVVRRDTVEPVPHRPHWQSIEYNALHGGMQRHFEAIPRAILQAQAWHRLMQWLGKVSSMLCGEQPWYTEAHQFRIDADGGIGRPTPEGAHRDGVDLVAVFLVARHAIKGGETRVFQADRPEGLRFTLQEPWSVLLLDDARVIHESTPIQPAAPDTPASYRDTLVVTLRAGGFQGDSA